MSSPPKRLRRSPPRGHRQRPGEAGSAAVAGCAIVLLAMVVFA